MPGISRRTRVYLEITLRPPGYRADFLNFASDFAPDWPAYTFPANKKENRGSPALGALGVQSVASHPGPGSSEAHPAGRMIGIGLRARTAPSRFLSSFPRKLRENRQFHGL